MSVRCEDALVFLEGRCPPEDAEGLLDLLRADPSRVVDLDGCEDMHTAVLQALLAVAPGLARPPRDPLLAVCLGLEAGPGPDLPPEPRC
jgi:hypothetical protein